mgnify:FL=1
MVTFANLIVSGFALAENAIVYNFINRIIRDKCVCSVDWRRDAIVGMTVMNFMLILISLLSAGTYRPSSYVWAVAMYSLVYFGVLLSYSYELKANKCKCAEGLDADIIYYSRMIDLFMVLFALTLIVITRITK